MGRRRGGRVILRTKRIARQIVEGVEGDDLMAEPLERPEAIEGGFVRCRGRRRTESSFDQTACSSVLGAQKRDDLFGVDDADQTLIVVDDRERAEVVLIEEFGNLASVSIDVAGDDVAVRKIGEWRPELCKQELHERDEGGDSLLVVEQIDVGDGVDVALEVAQGGDGLDRRWPSRAGRGTRWSCGRRRSRRRIRGALRPPGAPRGPSLRGWPRSARRRARRGDRRRRRGPSLRRCRRPARSRGTR